MAIAAKAFPLVAGRQISGSRGGGEKEEGGEEDGDDDDDEDEDGEERGSTRRTFRPIVKAVAPKRYIVQAVGVGIFLFLLLAFWDPAFRSFALFFKYFVLFWCLLLGH